MPLLTHATSHRRDPFPFMRSFVLMLMTFALLLSTGCGRDMLLGGGPTDGDSWETQESAETPGTPDDDRILEEVYITPDELMLSSNTGQNVRLMARYDTGPRVDVTEQAQWSLDDPSVAELVGTRVVAKSQGSTKLHASFANETAQIEVVVSGRRLDELRVAPTSAQVRPDGNFRFKAWGRWDDGFEEDITHLVTWSSADERVAAVSNAFDREGEVLGVTPGETTITAEAGELTDAASVSVSETSELVDLAISPPVEDLLLDGTASFEVDGIYTDGTTADLTPLVSWSVAPEGVIAIDSTGTVDALAAGEATIEANYNGLTTSALVRVRDAQVMDLRVDPARSRIGRGGQVQLYAEGILDDGTRRDLTDDVTWSTTDGAVVSVSQEGLAIGQSQGTVDVTARIQDIDAAARVVVSGAAMTALQVEPIDPVVGRGLRVEMRAMARYADGLVSEVTQAATWTTTNASVTSLTQEGVVRTRQDGTSVIIAEIDQLRATSNITVTDAELTQLNIEPTSLEMGPNQRALMRATGTWADGTTRDITQSVIWTSSSPEAVAISNEDGARGALWSVALGGATITASLQDVVAQANVTVTDRRIVEIEVTPEMITTPTGTQLKLEATGIFDDESERDITQQATWSSTNSFAAVASDKLSERGTVKALNPGQGDIEVRLGDVVASVPFTVTDATLTSIEIEPANATLTTGEVRAYDAYGLWDDGSRAPITDQITWSVTNDSVARVLNGGDARGEVQTLLPGTTEVRARLGDILARTSLVVEGAMINQLVITPRDSTTPQGETRPFAAQAIYEDGGARNVTAQATWTSDDASVATVDELGKMTAVSKGDTRINATYQGISASVPVTVNGAELVDLEITPQTPSMAVNTLMRFWATAIYSDGTRRDVSEGVGWDSSDQSVMSVFLHPRWAGIAISNAPGKATISAEYKGLKVSTEVTVTDATLVDIKLTPVDLEVAPGTSLQYAAQAIFDDGTSRDVTFLANWSSSDDRIATALPDWRDSGQVLARREGTVRIRAFYQNIAVTAELRVTGASVSHVQVVPFQPSVNQGDQIRFWATAVYDDGTTQQITDDALWQTGDSKIATISNARWQEGLVTAQAPGSTRILATYEGVTGESSLTVTGLQIQQIQVTPFIETIPSGYYLRMRATAIYSDGTSRDITGLSTWTSTDPMVADVFASFWVKGWAQGLSQGTAFIQATYQGVTGQARVNVTNATLSSITLDPEQATILPTETVEFEATGMFTDGSMREVTHYVTWSSSNQMVGDVSNAGPTRGEATGFAPGATTIKATQGSVSGEATLTVE